MSKDFNEYLPKDWQPNSEVLGENYYLAHSEMLSPASSTPLKLFPKLQQMTGGLRPYEFTILCGATGSGKTTLCANLSCDLLQQGVPQFIASVETGRTDYTKRMISAFAGRDWNTGDPVPLDDLKKFNDGHVELFKGEDAWLSLYDNRAKIENLMSDITFHVKHHGVKVAIIDNLNFFMEVTSAQNQVIEMDRVIHEMIIFCKKVPVHVIMVMHPKKTDHGRVESEFDIKGSSTAVQEAHNIFLFNRPHPELIKSGVASPGDRELLLGKMRRRGRFVRRRLILKAENSVRYFEGELV